MPSVLELLSRALFAEHHQQRTNGGQLQGGTAVLRPEELRVHAERGQRLEQFTFALPEPSDAQLSHQALKGLRVLGVKASPLTAAVSALRRRGHRECVHVQLLDQLLHCHGRLSLAIPARRRERRMQCAENRTGVQRDAAAVGTLCPEGLEGLACTFAWILTAQRGQGDDARRKRIGSQLARDPGRQTLQEECHHLSSVLVAAFRVLIRVRVVDTIH
mmetsp:Transcript_7627/g.23467  ORF Transcript_7627/g.23467 Transcript_7627/m.23467 type:complete len:217 (-) Transcript_7627:4163-4813(-)